jgi:diguanylate cyclase
MEPKTPQPEQKTPSHPRVLLAASCIRSKPTPNGLELEITNGVLIKDQARALSTLWRLKLLGVKIAMDDFGTDHASLSSLQSFPFDKLKIDKTLVSGVESNLQS